MMTMSMARFYPGDTTDRCGVCRSVVFLWDFLLLCLRRRSPSLHPRVYPALPRWVNIRIAEKENGVNCKVKESNFSSMM